MLAVVTKSGLILAAALVAIASVGANYRSLDGELVWDDRALILDNPAIQEPGRVAEALGRDYFHTDSEPLRYGYYRPISTLSLAVSYWTVGREPALYHLTNILLHVGCALFVLVLGLWLGFAPGAALAAALLFAVHPVHVESVCWISGRTDLLATFFGLGALLALSYTALRWDELSTSVRWLSVGGGTLLVALAVLSKEVALAIPLCVVIVCRADRTRDIPFRRLATILAPTAVLASVYVALRLFVLPLPSAELEEIGLVAKLSSALAGVVRYLWLFLWPSPQSPYMQVPSQTTPFAWLPLLGLAALAGLAWLWTKRDFSRQASTSKGKKKGRKKRGVAQRADRPDRWRLAATLLCALACLLPVLNLVRVSSPSDMGFTMAERFLYLPSVFLCLVVGQVIAAAASALSDRLPYSVFGVYGLAIVLLGWVSSARAVTWNDEISLFTQAVETAPDGTLPHVLLGQAYRQAGMVDLANEEIERARRLYRERGDTPPAALRVTEAGLLLADGDLEGAAGLLEAADVQALDSVVVHRDLATVYRLQRRPDLAREQLERALELAPREPRTWLQMTLLHVQANDLEQAEAAAARARELAPGDSATLHATGLVRRLQGDLEGAENAFRQALDAGGDVERLRLDLGVVLSERGQHDEAVALLGEAAEASHGALLVEMAHAVALLRADRLDEGTAILERLSAEHPGNQMVEHHLLRARLAMRQAEAASEPADDTNHAGAPIPTSDEPEEEHDD